MLTADEFRQLSAEERSKLFDEADERFEKFQMRLALRLYDTYGPDTPAKLAEVAQQVKDRMLEILEKRRKAES